MLQMNYLGAATLHVQKEFHQELQIVVTTIGV